MAKWRLAEPLARKRCYLASVRVKNPAEWRQCKLDLNTDIYSMSRDTHSKLPCWKAEVCRWFLQENMFRHNLRYGFLSSLSISTCCWLVSDIVVAALCTTSPIKDVGTEIHTVYFAGYCSLVTCAKGSTALAFKKITWSALIYMLICLYFSANRACTLAGHRCQWPKFASYFQKT